jgi:hypothetical protein
VSKQQEKKNTRLHPEVDSIESLDRILLEYEILEEDASDPRNYIIDSLSPYHCTCGARLTWSEYETCEDMCSSCLGEAVPILDTAEEYEFELDDIDEVDEENNDA